MSAEARSTSSCASLNSHPEFSAVNAVIDRARSELDDDVPMQKHIIVERDSVAVWLVCVELVVSASFNAFTTVRTPWFRIYNNAEHLTHELLCFSCRRLPPPLFVVARIYSTLFSETFYYSLHLCTESYHDNPIIVSSSTSLRKICASHEHRDMVLQRHPLFPYVSASTVRHRLVHL